MNIDQSSSTRVLLASIWGHLSSRRRIQLALLLLVMLASGGAELVSLGAVVAFLAVLSDPEQLWMQPPVQDLATHVGFTSASQLLFPVTLLFTGAVLLAASIRLANLWCIDRLAAAVGSDLSCEAYRRTLHQPYEVHVQRNSASVITGTTSHLARTVVALTAFLQLITGSVVATGLLLGLVFINSAIAFGSIALFAALYFLLAITTRRELKLNSQRIAVSSKQQIKALQEGLGAIRDILLNGNQGDYVEKYRQADWPQRQLQAKNRFLGAFPRYAMEALGLTAIAILGGLLVNGKGSSSSIIPLLGAFALGAQRLLPALQQVYGSWSNLKGLNADLSAVLVLLNQRLPPLVTVAEPLALQDHICFEGVHFRYDLDQPEILKGMNLKINRGDRIGLIGSTGCGKSTTADLLMGLLTPTAGHIFVDGFDLNDPAHPNRLAAWRKAIAHVPQNIYLADSSIAQNIAFGVPSSKIDLERVKEAAKQSKISGFIESNPQGYDSFVGELGIRLSAGQRQRIGIARALYKQAKVLVFDEATSALDNATEEAVMMSMQFLSKELTIVMIAHRLTTLKECDRVIRIKDGRAIEEPIDQFRSS